MVKKSYALFLLALIAAGFFLAGCSSTGEYTKPVATDTAIGHGLAAHQALLEKIQANDVKIIQVGDTLTLVLPSDRFFVDETPVLNRDYYSTLNQIAALLCSFDKFSIKVAGYTGNRGWPLRNLALSRAQAFAVANYLWSRGIDTRMMSSIGYGDVTPIANNNTEAGQAMNRRIEITLRVISEPDDM